MLTTRQLIDALASATPSEAADIEFKLACRCLMSDPDAVAFFNPPRQALRIVGDAPTAA